MSLGSQVPKEVYPLAVFVGAVVALAGYRMYTMARLPEVQFWTKKENLSAFKIGESADAAAKDKAH